MNQTMRRIKKGKLDARITDIKSKDEIGEVANHLNALLDQVQERDRKLRDWADTLNDKVDRRTNELHRANDKLEETYKQLVVSEKLASIGEITAGIAHEINNPVAVIQGNIDVMRMALGENVSEHLNDSLVLVQHSLMRAGIVTERDFKAAPLVQINEGELQQVLVNLLINAIQSMPDGGILFMGVNSAVRDGHPGVEIHIKDNGVGISPHNLDQVFDPFFTTKQGAGTGLGLSISQSLIQRAGGIITAKSKVGSGSRFIIWLAQ